MSIHNSIFRLAAVALLAYAAIPSYAADPATEEPGQAQGFVKDSTITTRAKAALASNKLTNITV